MSNVFSFTGTLGRDAEVKTLPSGQTMLVATVANNIGFGDKQKTLWVRVTVWGKRAEGQLVNYLKKGQQVFVSGELTQNEYQAQDGTKKSSLELNANILDLVWGKGNKADAPSQGSSTQAQRPNAAATPRQPATDNFADFDDDIPF